MSSGFGATPEGYGLDLPFLAQRGRSARTASVPSQTARAAAASAITTSAASWRAASAAAAAIPRSASDSRRKSAPRARRWPAGLGVVRGGVVGEGLVPLALVLAVALALLVLEQVRCAPAVHLRPRPVMDISAEAADEVVAGRHPGDVLECERTAHGPAFRQGALARCLGAGGGTCVAFERRILLADVPERGAVQRLPEARKLRRHGLSRKREGRVRDPDEPGQLGVTQDRPAEQEAVQHAADELAQRAPG